MNIVTLPYEKRTVFAGNGASDLGFVTEEVASAVYCKSGPIRLLNGVANGFGLAHINRHQNRVKQIMGMGFRDVRSYTHFIAAGYTKIARQEDGRLVFLREREAMVHWLVCQWDAELRIWSVTTAIPKAVLRGLDIVWEV